MNINQAYDQVLDKLLLTKKQYPEFTFWVRKKVDGLHKGFWFQGTERYISVGLVKEGSGNLSTKSIALHFDFKNDVIYGSLILENRYLNNSKYSVFYNDFAKLLIATEKNHTWYKPFDNSRGIDSIVDDFMRFYPSIIELIRKHHLEKELLLDEPTFKKNLDRLLKFRKNNEFNHHNKDMKNTLQNLNQILYGPPGTGKTFSTIDKVVSICSPDDYIPENHEHNKTVYDQLNTEGRVVFTTFHQSMSYEDFIEGIKPVKPSEEDQFLKYEVEPGIFFKIAKKAEKLVHVSNQSVDWDRVRYFKMSIGGKNRPDIHDYCVSKRIVGLGWGGEENLSGISTIKDWTSYRDQFKERFPDTAEENRYHIQASFLFNRMNIGDIVVVTKGNHIIDAIGKITGEYEYNDENPTGFYHFRNIEWIATDMNASPEKFFRKQISQQSIYEFYDEDIKRETFKELTASTVQQTKPYVLVIDEINRGNVSAIFGELITLIESDKRLGEANELTVTLPYSKEKFGVPSNLYIIGTMNTADRSVEALDTALRRRFSFVEMLPDPELLNAKEIEGIALSNLLKTLNERIEVLVDRDHTIGHAFFINDQNLDDLRNTFANKIIPLLQEYFYGDYGKMELVIGSAFFAITEVSKVKFAVRSDDFDAAGKVYHIKNIADKAKFPDSAFLEALNALINGQA